MLATAMSAQLDTVSDEGVSISPNQPVDTGGVEAALGGNPHAFGRLMDQLERPALGVAIGVTRDVHLAADAVQDACLKAWHARNDLREVEKIDGWFLQIVRRCALDQLRRRRPAGRIDSGSRSDEPSTINPVARSTMTPDEVFARRERDEAVSAVIGELDEASRVAVALRFYDARSSAEIAQVLGCSPAAVDMRLKRARQRLAELFRERGISGV